MLNIIDWRADMPRHSTRRAPVRSGAASFATLHYNGPPINQTRTLDQWRAHLQFIARWHMDSAIVQGDGIQYHYAILPGGEVAQLRDTNVRLSHCGNATGNRDSLAVHFPLGGSQQPTPAAWHTWQLLHGTLNLPRERVYGHRQWPRKSGLPSLETRAQRGQGDCPGDGLMALLMAWKAPQAQYRTRYRAVVREAPNALADIAWNGDALLPVGFELLEATPVEGVPYKGDARWLHWPAGGFIHWSAIEQVTQGQP